MISLRPRWDFRLLVSQRHLASLPGQQVTQCLACQRFVGVMILSLSLIAALAGGFTHVRANEFFEISGFFPVAIAGEKVRLESMLVKKADAQGRMPVAIFTNGGLTTTAGLNSSRDFARNARDLARRGWLAIVVIRRGYGQSEGPKPGPVPCSPAAVRSFAAAAADDLAATMAFVAQRPDADPSRFMVIGPESGGVATVALAARNPPGLVAAVSIAGAILPEGSCAMADILAGIFREFGAGSRVPHLWVYAKNDVAISRDLTERIHAAFLDGGGDVKFVEFHSWGNVDGDLFRRSRQQWMLQLDAFLRERGLPTWTIADVWNIVDRIGLPEASRDSLFSFLGEEYFPHGGEVAAYYSSRTHDSGKWKVFWGRADTLDDAKKRASEQCQKRAADCVLVMENLRWVGPGSEREKHQDRARSP